VRAALAAHPTACLCPQLPLVALLLLLLLLLRCALMHQR